MRTKLIGDGKRSDAWQYRVRDLAVTMMLVAQFLIIFAAPFATMGYGGAREVMALLFFFIYLLGLFALSGSSCHFLRDLCVYLRPHRLRTRARSTINYRCPGFCLYRSDQRLHCGELRSRLRDARAGQSDVSQGVGRDRALFEYRADVCGDISNDLVFHPKFAD